MLNQEVKLKRIKLMKVNRVDRLIGVTLGVLACVVIAHTSSARVVQGFESGDPAVTATGDASNQGTFEGEAAPQGSKQFLLTSLIGTADNDGATDVSGAPAVSNASLESFFNGQINSSLIGLRGSGVFIPFTVMTGDTTLTFQYDFLSNQPGQSSPKNDFALEGIFTGSGPTLTLQGSAARFAQVTGTSFSLFGSGSPFSFHTGYQTFSINISSLAPGSYSLGIGMEALSGGSNQHDSGLLIDNFQIVPEPTTIAFSIAGAALLVALRSRIKKTS
jgi:hypothetical protein